jgi:uncharacterized protein (DUF934 family)
MNTTQRKLLFVAADSDPWTVAPAEGEITPAPHLLLTWDQWQALRGQWPQSLPVGVVFPNTGNVHELLPDLPRLGLIALPFPKWTDGRAYSLARTLRVRHRFAGELRAIGDVIPDMAGQLHRTGFTSVALRAGESAETAQRMLNFVPEFYQADTLQPRQRFAREGAPASPARPPEGAHSRSTGSAEGRRVQQ